MKKLAFISFFIFSFTAFTAYSKNIWESQKEPAKGKTESIGTYSNGCIKGAQELPLDGNGYQIMRPSRDRYYANPEMKEYILSLANKVKTQLHNILIVGDIALPKGGPFTTGHRSHETGLDADFWYQTPPAALTRHLSRVEREKLASPSMVDLKNKIINDNWTAYQRQLLKTAASDENVDRIFVNPAIKMQLCKTDKGADWLSKIRPWYGHEDHFHVRLKCPADEPACKAPADYQQISGDGCDSSLKWWFTERTKEELEAMKKAEERKKAQKLPTACMKLVK